MKGWRSQWASQSTCQLAYPFPSFPVLSSAGNKKTARSESGEEQGKRVGKNDDLQSDAMSQADHILSVLDSCPEVAAIEESAPAAHYVPA